jgi:aspartate-semialdehyde dehydrogenase
MRIGVVGASGEVGGKMIKILGELKLPNIDLVPFASARSLGKKVLFNGKEIDIRELTHKSMTEKFDYLLFSAGSSISKEFTPIAVENDNTVIDNSSAFRRDTNIPLVVPEINGHNLKDYKGIVANPNCSTIQMVLALADLHRKYKLRKIVVSTYQAVSGAGKTAINELLQQENGKNEIKKFPAMIKRNVIPEIGSYIDDGYTDEEEKMRFETNKILESDNILVAPTTVRVPVIYGHSESIYCEFENKVNLDEIVKLWNANPVIQFSEDLVTPMDCEDSDLTFVSRLRYGVDNSSINFWCVADNIRVGAATNAVRIMKKHLEIN